MLPNRIRDEPKYTMSEGGQGDAKHRRRLDRLCHHIRPDSAAERVSDTACSTTLPQFCVVLDLDETLVHSEIGAGRRNISTPCSFELVLEDNTSGTGRPPS